MAYSGVYHPDITVRTAYDLKPYARILVGCVWRPKNELTYVNNYFYYPHICAVAFCEGKYGLTACESS